MPLSHLTFHLAHRAFSLQGYLNSLIILTHIRVVRIYTPGWREAIEIQHSAQECKHGDMARIRIHDCLITGPMTKQF